METNFQLFTGFLISLIVSVVMTLGILFKTKPTTILTTLSKWVGITLLLLINIFFAVASFERYSDYNRYKPRVATEMNGISLGISYSDVLFKKGKPQDDIKGGEKGYGLEYSHVLHYIDESDTGEIIRLDSADRVVLVGMFCGDSSWKQANGIRCNEEMPLQRFAAHSSQESISSDNLRRMYCYPDLNVCYNGEQAKVKTILVYDVMHYPEGLEYGKVRK